MRTNPRRCEEANRLFEPVRVVAGEECREKKVENNGRKTAKLAAVIASPTSIADQSATLTER